MPLYWEKGFGIDLGDFVFQVLRQKTMLKPGLAVKAWVKHRSALHFEEVKVSEEGDLGMGKTFIT